MKQGEKSCDRFQYCTSFSVNEYPKAKSETIISSKRAALKFVPNDARYARFLSVGRGKM